jgi:hypothetical protein
MTEREHFNPQTGQLVAIDKSDEEWAEVDARQQELNASISPDLADGSFAQAPPDFIDAFNSADTLIIDDEPASRTAPPSGQEHPRATASSTTTTATATDRTPTADPPSHRTPQGRITPRVRPAAAPALRPRPGSGSTVKGSCPISWTRQGEPPRRIIERVGFASRLASSRPNPLGGPDSRPDAGCQG